VGGMPGSGTFGPEGVGSGGGMGEGSAGSIVGPPGKGTGNGRGRGLKGGTGHGRGRGGNVGPACDAAGDSSSTASVAERKEAIVVRVSGLMTLLQIVDSYGAPFVGHGLPRAVLARKPALGKASGVVTCPCENSALLVAG
jgi:hypothetical protein